MWDLGLASGLLASRFAVVSLEKGRHGCDSSVCLKAFVSCFNPSPNSIDKLFSVCLGLRPQIRIGHALSAVKRVVPDTSGTQHGSLVGAVMGMTWIFGLGRLVENF